MRFVIYFFLLTFLVTFSQVKAQVSVQDSLALVALYNKVPALQSDTTWLNGNVSTWSHVIIVENKRVRMLDLSWLVVDDVIPIEVCGLDSLFYLSLSNCQFKGLVPACVVEMPTLQVLAVSGNQLIGIEPGADFSKLTSIEAIYITNNHFSEMPDFHSITSPRFSSLEAANNDFNFDDLLPTLADSLLFIYQVQHEVSAYQAMSPAVASDTVDFPDVAGVMGGTNNNYRWVRVIGTDTLTLSSERFKNINGSKLRLEGALLEDNGFYACQATNPDLPGLTLSTGVFYLNVTDPLLTQTITYLGSNTAYCGDTPLQLSASALGGRPITFTSLDPRMVTVNSNNTLTLLVDGNVTIQATTAADSVYHAASLLIPITITSHELLPTSFPITKLFPTYIGQALSASVEYFPSFTYKWTLPSGELQDSATLLISPFNQSYNGHYELRITEGTCVYSSQSFEFNLNQFGKPLIYELITPNGDGDNETFYIDNLDPAVHNEVTIFNVAHQIVFHEENYRNNWQANNLPIGTYYYLVKLGTETYKGNLYIKR